MAERIFIIQQSDRNVRLHTANVSESYTPPSLEDDMDDIGLAVFGAHYRGALQSDEQDVPCVP